MSKYLVTGGTGSVGRRVVKRLLDEHQSVTVLSRDEAKQHEMKLEFNHLRLNFIPCDVRDFSSFKRAIQGHKNIIHTAAFKHVPVCESYPSEAIKTNIKGVENLLRAVRNSKVERVVIVSTDKAVHPTTVMGASKLIQEKLVLAEVENERYSGRGRYYTIVRYGNLLASRGSVYHTFKSQIEKGLPLTVTSLDATRYIMEMDSAVDLIMKAANTWTYAPIFIPQIRSVSMKTLVNVLAPEDYKIEEIGLREGEKMHESMLTDEEARHVELYDGIYSIDKLTNTNYNLDCLRYSNHKDALMGIEEFKQCYQNYL